MKLIIRSHNKKLLRTDTTANDCKRLKKNKNKCSLPSKYNTENVIYKATVFSDNFVKTCIGSTVQYFKKRWYGHCFSFRIENPNCISCKAIRDCTSSSNSRDSSNSKLFDRLHAYALSHNFGRVCMEVKAKLTQL